ncbi:MAG: TAXI family TRAP transporter solute-binding subunit [Burkholderiaceae bacterium]|nr:TAXI family TRAP transporter solute-binding subunit [Burkholderiaceae bacterium]
MQYLRPRHAPPHPTPRPVRHHLLRRLLLSLSLAAATASAAPADDFSDKFLMLGTGPVGGTFRPVGEALCDAINEDREASLVRCVPVGTAGTTFNLHAVSNQSIQLGIAQEDLLAQLQRNAAVPKAQALRTVAVLHTSPIAVMVRKDSGIGTLAQIAGKRMNLGNRGSGQFAITAALLRALDLRVEDLGSASYLATSEFERAFCGGQVDVVVEAVAHPSPLFAALRACGGEFIDLPEPVRQRLAAENPWLSAQQIPAALYPGRQQPVQTLGMRNLLFTQAAVDDESIFRLTQSLRRRQAELQRSQPLLDSMQRLDAFDAARLAAPLHRGAARAYGLAPSPTPRLALQKDSR